MRAKTVFDCAGDSVDELSFRSGEIISDVKPADDEGWFRGTLNGRTGIFPGNYVEFDKEEPKTAPGIPARTATGRSVSGGAAAGLTSSASTTPLPRSFSQSSLGSASNTPPQTSSPSLPRLRQAPKPADFAGSNDTKGNEESISSGSTSDTAAWAQKKLAAHNTRAALREKSDAMVKQGRDSIVGGSRVASGGEGDGQAALARVMSRSVSGSSIASSNGAGGNPAVATLRNKFAGLSTSESDSFNDPSVAKTSGTAGPPIAKRAALMQSNDFSRAPPPPTRPSRPQDARPESDESDEPAKLLKPSELRARGGGPFGSPSSTPPVASRPQPPATSSGVTKSPPASAAQAAPPLPSRPPAGGPSTAAPPSQPLPPPRPVPPRPTPSQTPSPVPSSTSSLPPPSHDHLTRYTTLFSQTDTQHRGYIDGDTTRQLWFRSGIDAKTLGLVWNASDRTDDGLLDRREFCIGMYLIDLHLGGALPVIPSQVPSHIVDAVVRAVDV
ncbi:hypothetical protein DFS34DRAFT_273381 [Phlyctochytrium arcticum]|nr:hypothetical protein DFS34DRAFT_273381 [Phlyctochytrium arcticum]